MQNELDLLSTTLEDNSYPLPFIKKYACVRPRADPIQLAEKKDVYIKIPFKGDVAQDQITKRLKATINRCYFSANLRVLSDSRKLPLPFNREKTPISTTSHCVYQFKCSCSSTYIGRTDRTMKLRMAEHLPKWVIQAAMTNSCASASSSHATPISTIAKHVLTSGHKPNHAESFSILMKNTTSKILRFSEALYIKHLQPDLCIQKDRLIELKLSWF